MNNKFFTFVLTLMLFGYANISGQTIIVNAIDDTNDGVCNAAHCSLREAIILANTYTNPEILIQIDPTVPQPWVIRPTTNLPKIQSTDTLFNLSLIGPYNRDVVIGGSLLPGKDTESDYGLVIDTKGKVDIKKLSFRDFSKALIVSNVDTLILGGVKSDLGGEDGNSFYFNKKDLYFDGLFEYCRITSNYFGSDRFLNQGVGYGETGISCRDGLKNRGKLIIGIGAIRHEKSNRFSGHTIAGIDLTGLSNVEINDNFFDTDFSAQSLLPPSKNNIRLKNCDSIFMSENYLGGTDTQMHLIECKNANIEWNNFGTINYYLVYPMKYGVVLDHCENINVGGTDPLKLNHYHGHTVSSIQVQNQSTNINILNNHIGTHTILNLPFVKNGITIEDSDHIHISENFFLGTVDNCVRVLNSEDLVILKNDFSVFNSFPPGGTGIYIENAQNINIGDPDMARNNIFSRLDKVVDIYGEESKQIYNYQNSFFCNSGKGLTLQTGANGNITPPFPYKRTGNIVYGKAHPLALVQIYNHGEECPQTPCQGKQHLDQIYADINGFWSFDFTGQLTGRKTFTATHPDLGTSEFSECYFIPDIILMSLTKIGNVCDDQIVKATLTSPPPGVMYSWSGPDGFVSASQEITTTNSGWYHVEVSHVTWNYTLSDSIFVQSIQPSVNSIGSSLCAGKSFSVEGHTFDESNPEGQFLSMYKSAAGCDSIINVKLTFKQPVELFITPKLCKTETYTIGGSVFSINNPNGIAILQAGNAVECDTIVHVTLAFIENATETIQPSLCSGQSFRIEDHIFDESNPEGQFLSMYKSAAGCDSIINVKLTFKQTVELFITPELCKTETYTIGGSVFSINNPNGIAILQAGNAVECDTIVHVTLAFIENATGTIQPSLCAGKSFSVEGHTFDESNPEGQFLSMYKSAAGCDSIINVKLTFKQPVELFITPELCKTETYTIGGSVFSINNPNGIAILQAGNAVECDTIVHVTLAFIENATRYLDSVACKGEIIEISGHILTESNPEKLIDLNIQSHAGCDSLLSVRIRFIKPVITTLSTFSACHGVNDGSITFSIDSSMNKPFNVFVNNVNLWQSTESYQEVKGLSAGNYIVRITDHRGCTSEVRSVEIEEAPINEITTPQNLEIPEGTAHQIELSTSVISNDVIWSPATYLSCTQCIEPVITPLSDQSYSYRIEDENGCITEGTIVVNVIQKVEAKLFVPNVFSPNGDGKNDHIVIHFANLTLQKMNIFDRWGGLVYSSVTDFSWDGKWNNRLVDPGVYVCMIKYQDDKNSDDKVYIGNIIVIR